MSRNTWIAIIALEIIALCCCAGLGALYVVGSFSAFTTTPTAIAQATVTPVRVTLTAAPTQTTAPTNTFVVQSRATSTSQANTRARVTPPSNLYLVLVPTPTAARVVYPVDFSDTFVLVTYAVNGSTLSAISQSLEANARADPHEPGSKFYAETNWQISYSTSRKSTARGCELDKGSVTIAVTMTLPALVTPNVPRDVADRWSNFIKRGIIHESGHVKLAQDGARSFQRDLGNVSPSPTCDALDTRIKDLFITDFKSIEKLNVQYDADTQHGVTQGAVFP